jgi:hypothetical protein
VIALAQNRVVAQPLRRLSAMPAPRLELVDPRTDVAWDAEVASHPHSTVFHTAAWASVLQHTYHHKLLYARFSQTGTASALVPLAEIRSFLTGTRGLCLPFTDACEPLLSSTNAGDGPLDGLFSTLCDLGRRRGWKYLEIRGQAGLPQEARPSIEFVGHELDLTPGPVKLLAGFAPSVRRAIRKAESSGLCTEIRSDLEAVRSYYELHAQTRRRHGVPPQSWSFFRNLHRFLIAEGRGMVILARHESRPVAGAVFLYAGKNAIYKYGAADRAFQSMRPANLVMASAIRDLAERGLEKLDLGRTSLANEGLRRFKRGWGASERTIRYYRYDPRAESWLTSSDRSQGWHNEVFRRVPALLNRLLGKFLYPHLD